MYIVINFNIHVYCDVNMLTLIFVLALLVIIVALLNDEETVPTYLRFSFPLLNNSFYLMVSLLK